MSLDDPTLHTSDLGQDLNAEGWLEMHPARGTSQFRLYCMPSSLGRHPGASLLGSEVAEHAEICLVQTPVWSGKAPSILAQAHALARTLFEHAEDRPFALFGHCSGAILMYEVAR